MDSCYYLDISKSRWINTLKEDKRLISLLLDSRPGAGHMKIRFIFIFSDYIPKESDIPEVVWKYTGQGFIAILVILDYPYQLNQCWKLINRGIADIVIWEGIEALFKLMEKKEKKWDTINNILESPLVHDNLIGDSRQWKRFLSEVIEASIFSSSNILITGESGTGKELVARLVHTLDERAKKGKIIMVDCTTIVPDLSGSEFFGHEKGSYTSSVSSREGAFALADNGTLFLDEIADLPLTLQAELLRVIQEKTYKRIGSNTWRTTDFRLVSATNRNLRTLIQEGKFREDLYYRISDIELFVPPLREHSDDIEILAGHFLKQICHEMPGSDELEFDPEVRDFIINRSYQGNIRELRQLIRRIVMRHEGGRYITLGSIPAQDRPKLFDSDSMMTIIERWEDSIRKAVISGESLQGIKSITTYLATKVAVQLEKGDKQKAAKRLNVTLRAVQQHIRKRLTIS